MAKKKIKAKRWERFYGINAYYRMAKESEGFDVCSDGRFLCGGICPLMGSKDALERAVAAAKFAVQKHNEENNTDLEFVRMVNANKQAVSGVLYYLTIEVRSTSLNQTSIYQTQVLSHKEYVVEIFRERPHDYVPPGPKVWNKQILVPNKQILVPKGAFLGFMSDLRKLPQFDNLRLRHVSALASKMWKTMSAKEKVDYYNARDLKFEEITHYVKKADLNNVLSSRRKRTTKCKGLFTQKKKCKGLEI